MKRMTLRLRHDAVEVSPREPHKRWYKSPGREKWSSVEVDDMGVVTVSEEALHHLLTEAGYVETEPPKWALPDGTNGDALDRWVESGGIGGYVCSVCGVPVESEPCDIHQPAAYARCVGTDRTNRSEETR